MQGEPILRWKCRDRILAIADRPMIMGILNVTPDSFSDGGRHFDRDGAISHGRRMAEEGADIIDVGGESTRPGAGSVNEEEETGRVVPVIEALADSTSAVISVDTQKAAVARKAMEAGAHVINDVSALTHDPATAEVAREFGAGIVLMHMRGTPRTMQQAPGYEDVVREVRDYLAARVDALERAGLEADTMAVDPGIGFGKTVEHNLRLLGNLDALAGLGLPVVIGLSRKSFLGKLTGRETGGRLPASLAGLVYCLVRGAHVMRVHDVPESLDAVRIAAALKASEEMER